MIPDYALRLSENQQVLTGAAVTSNVIDLVSTRNIALGEPLYAVISITESYDAAGVDDPLIQWVFYLSPTTTGTDGDSAIVLGSSGVMSGNLADAVPRNLHKGQRITVALSPHTAHSTDTSAPFPVNTTIGKRYIFGVIAVTGTGDFTAGKFTIDICTQAMLGGSSVYSDVPVYPTGITIA